MRWTATAAAQWPLVPMFLTVTTAHVRLVMPVMALIAEVINASADTDNNITERLFATLSLPCFRALTSVLHGKHSF